MAQPLIVTETEARLHFGRLKDSLTMAVDESARLHISTDSSLSGLVAGLTGSGCEYVERDRGGRAAVAPLIVLQKGLWAWLGYREEWDEEARKGPARRFSFRSSSISIHFGWRNDTFKPQVFRAEWAGWTKWDGINLSFQATNAAHPHWQFDALESLADDATAERSEFLHRLLEGEGTVREFEPQVLARDARDIIRTQKMSRIHFASAAAWWKTAPQDRHAHGPEKIKDLEEWTRKSIAYVRDELKRLQN